LTCADLLLDVECAMTVGMTVDKKPGPESGS